MTRSTGTTSRSSIFGLFSACVGWAGPRLRGTSRFRQVRPPSPCTVVPPVPARSAWPFPAYQAGSRTSAGPVDGRVPADRLHQLACDGPQRLLHNLPHPAVIALQGLPPGRNPPDALHGTHLSWGHLSDSLPPGRQADGAGASVVGAPCGDLLAERGLQGP